METQLQALPYRAVPWESPAMERATSHARETLEQWPPRQWVLRWIPQVVPFMKYCRISNLHKCISGDLAHKYHKWLRVQWPLDFWILQTIIFSNEFKALTGNFLLCQVSTFRNTYWWCSRSIILTTESRKVMYNENNIVLQVEQVQLFKNLYCPSFLNFTLDQWKL